MISLFGVWAAIAIHTGVGCAASSAGDLKIRLGDAGLASLQYHGEDLLSDGALGVQHVTLTGAGGQISDGDLKIIAAMVDAQSHKVKRTYSWGAVSCVYAVQGDRLNLRIGVQNTSDSTLSSIAIQPLELKFPQAPQGWVPNYVYLGANQGAPTVEYANYGSGALAVCNDDVVRPLVVGFPGRESLTVRPLLIATSSAGQMSSRLDPYLKRPVAPHSYDTYSISVRFGSASVTDAGLASDLLKKFAAKYPPTLRWKDRRSIGTLHLSTSEPDHHSATNPRGWFLDPAMDVKTPAGKEALRKRLLEYADNSIKVLKKMNAQGMITWDIEGQEYPHATSYIGDPRIVKEIAPEMDAMADAYFKRFHDAGLRTGVCVRPQQLSHTPAKTEQQDVTGTDKIVALLY
ncbi:MAG: Ig domain protein group 2 domain protein, partial [Capsulimonas sp.]|nr:Ig domain protein group 2 domain protein [Capsulimonas sp.]